MLLWSPCKNLKPYDNPFWDFNKVGANNNNNNKKRNNLPKIVAYLSLLRWLHALLSDQLSRMMTRYWLTLLRMGKHTCNGSHCKTE